MIAGLEGIWVKPATRAQGRSPECRLGVLVSVSRFSQHFLRVWVNRRQSQQAPPAGMRGEDLESRSGEVGYGDAFSNKRHTENA